MPTYEYECPKCGIYDLFQSITEKPRRICPKCKSRVKRLLGTGAGLIFKGSGFYSTDYRKPGYKEAAKQDSAPSTPAATGKDASTSTSSTPSSTPSSSSPSSSSSSSPATKSNKGTTKKD